MELWVRSQNKKRLFEVEDIYTQKVAEDYLLFDQNKYCVGAYKTEERCLEIIDEIQKLLLSADPKEAFMVVDCRSENEFPHISRLVDFARERNFIAFDGSEGTSVQLVQPSVLVYEMPQE